MFSNALWKSVLDTFTTDFLEFLQKPSFAFYFMVKHNLGLKTTTLPYKTTQARYFS